MFLVILPTSPAISPEKIVKTILLEILGIHPHTQPSFFGYESRSMFFPSLLRRGSMGCYVYPLNEVSAGAKAERVDLAVNLCQKHVVFLYILVVLLYIGRFLAHL